MNVQFPLFQVMGLKSFIDESNRIEGIIKPPAGPITELGVYIDLLNLDRIRKSDLVNFNRLVQPGARLRDKPGLDVKVGNHIAPSGGPEISGRLRAILAMDQPWHQHQAFEHLHPFTDGNGRTGRALWLWHMLNRGKEAEVIRYGFLHLFYYQTLEAHDQENL
jgi:hypothetical protein